MPASNGFILGFDPGGKGKFGWSVCRVSNGQLQPCPKTGLADNAWDALLTVNHELGRYSPSGNSQVLAAGIDAPLFWSTSGNRQVDDRLDEEMKATGYPPPKNGGRIVQAVNSLRGGCLVQGMLLSKYLHDERPSLPITETHPKVLWHLLHQLGQPTEIEMMEHAIQGLVDDERDATLAAVAAWSMTQESPCGWQNLHDLECHPIQPFDIPVSYWMPIS